jgi:hypothetical protein
MEFAQYDYTLATGHFMPTEDEEGMNIIKHSSNDSSNDNITLAQKLSFFVGVSQLSRPWKGRPVSYRH